MNRPACLCLVAGAVSAATIFGLIHSTAAGEHGHGAHEHGVGQLNLAVEGDEVEIELTVPGADAVGFEHAPSTNAQKQAVREAARALKVADKLFAFPKAAGCRAEKAEVGSALMDAAGSKDEKHGHAHEKEHEHGDDKRKDEEAHAEFRAHYHFHCENPGELTHVDLGFFKAFPSARELQARTITPSGQGAAELTAEAPRLKF